ncbi:Alpha/Beta hydrolase protein [Lentinula guzmanii]|uniref:Carboxylic ester hydrolase n=1 Tax=Lentinula guzmanii TaxID=2804957 RepID=A0AA38JC61_9AGAR|nr:Alpha/Beta hydrolase protein [Lentinula guzmanii]
MLTLKAFFALCSVYTSIVAGQATVELDYGTFTGVEDSTTGVTSFKGVRFAEPPTGNQRWKAPVFPPTTQLGTVNATSFGNACIPVPQSTVVSGTSEDCLFTNVYVPLGATSDSNLPVMVWFHGGGFQTGNSRANAIPLMQSAPEPGIVFVSFEYRLGQFGFLAGSTFAAANGSLNAGMLDQRTGLQWVQRYISSFGGDPTKVTIWGESAGAGATMFHLIANGGDQEGLFRASMGDSSSLSFMPDSDSDYLNGVFDLFAGFADCSSSSDVMACLTAADANTIASAGTQVLQNRTSTLFVFAPCIDGTFLATRPVEAFASGEFAQVPVLFGSNTDEGANWSAELPNPAANTSEPDATETTVYNFLAGQWPTLSNTSFTAALELYPLSDYNNSLSLQGQQMYGEARYICTGLMIAAAATRQGFNSFQYHYDNPDQGSDHGADLTALFDSASGFTGNDAALFVAMQQFWTSFVAAQDPNATDTTTWTAVTNSTSGSPRILLHPGAIAMEDVTDAQAARCAFWHSISAEMST